MNDCIIRIENYLKDKDTTLPLFVNVETSAQKAEIYEHFNVGNNAIVHVADFAKPDGLPNVMALVDNLKKSDKVTFVFGLTTYLMLRGNTELQDTISMLCNMTIQKKVVIVCLHCLDVFNFLKKRDLRVDQRVVTVNESSAPVRPTITFVSPEYSPEAFVIINGVEKLPEAIEDNDCDELFVKTVKAPKVFEKGQYAVSILNNPLQVLQSKFQELASLEYKDSEAAYWNYLLALSEGKSSFRSIVREHFNDNYEFALQDWNNYDDRTKWLLFISMRVFPDVKNQVIRDMVNNAGSHFELMRALLRAILNYSHNEKNYQKYYKQWKILRSRLSVPEEEVADYCEYVDQKGKDAIYYLTDLTKIEKEKAIKLIGMYQSEFNDHELTAILKSNFLDFYYYLTPYYYDNTLLDSYFAQYTKQKLRNVVFPDFEELVNQEAEDRHFVELPSRAEIVSELYKENTVLYFVDALGVEFLNYILQKCADKGLFADAKIAKCNLPSITDVNKEFVKDFESQKAEIVDYIKQIDKDKHDAIGDYNFTKSEYPIHLIDELETIDKVLTNISTKLAASKLKCAYIISDHGASRLAVIKKSILPIESNRTGTHGGRVSEYNDLTKNLPHAIHEGKLCMLAGYDRFDGSRPAAVETHGGASLEEVVVPIIRITKNNCVWEFKLMNEDNKVMFSYKTAPVLIIWSKNEISNLSVKIDGKPYTGIQDADKKTFKFLIDKPEHACDCCADIYVSNNLVKSGVSFRIEREGVQKNSGIAFGNMNLGGFKKK